MRLGDYEAGASIPSVVKASFTTACTLSVFGLHVAGDGKVSNERNVGEERG